MWNKLGQTGEGILNFAVPIGFAILIVGSIATALGAGDAANVLNAIITDVGKAVGTWVPIVLAIFFALIVYGAYKQISKSGKGK